MVMVSGGPGSRRRARMLRRRRPSGRPRRAPRRRPPRPRPGHRSAPRSRCRPFDGRRGARRGLAAHALERRRQQPGLKRGAIPERARLAGQHRRIVPGVVHGLAAAEDAAVLADDAAILAQLDAIGPRDRYGPGSRPAGRRRSPRPSPCCCRTGPRRGCGDPAPHKVQVLETVAGTAWKPLNGPA